MIAEPQSQCLTVDQQTGAVVETLDSCVVTAATLHTAEAIFKADREWVIQKGETIKFEVNFDTQTVGLMIEQPRPDTTYSYTLVLSLLALVFAIGVLIVTIARR